MDELKQNGKCTWVNVGEHLVVGSGNIEDCEWYGSNRIVKKIFLADSEFILLLA